MESLAAYVPELRAGRGWLIGLIALASFVAATAVLIPIDRLAPAWTGLGQIATILLGFLWTGQFFWRRKKYRLRWGDQAYRREVPALWPRLKNADDFFRFLLQGKNDEGGLQ